ncbi:cobalamin-dependent protein [Candidatus Bathyarchaeota archaeon]|nr:cobalamin-dependent protein [Candidatus Bathyarchaeota archaeon]
MAAENRLLEDVKKVFAEVASVDEARACVKKALDAGVSSLDITGSMSEGLEEVGRRYEKCEYFLSELIMAGIMATEVSSMLKPLGSTPERPSSTGKVVIGTVKGDVHDIGKNIVSAMLMSTGYDVVDLGVDVPAERFVEAVRSETPDILALSCLLSHAVGQMPKVIDQLSSSGLKQKVKVMVGGRPIDRKSAMAMGADGYAEDAMKALEEIKNLLTAKYAPNSR